MTAYTATLRDYTIGTGQPFCWRYAPDGLGVGGYRTSRLQRQFTDGSTVLGPDLTQSRLMTFEVLVRDTPANAEAEIEALNAAWAPVRSGVVPLLVTVAAEESVLFGRPIDVSIDATRINIGIVRARLVFEATDPRRFSADESALVLGLTPGGGLEFPLVFPLTFGAGSDSDGSAVNAGTFETEWTATIVGPVTTPRLTLGETGQFVELDGVIPAGSTLIVSSADGSVLLNGSPRQSWVTLLSRFWKLPAGTSTVRFRAAAGTGVCTFAWRSAKL